jgi:Arc/MetJ-type ribon-helix-helix transcriptional regulator
MTTVKVTVTIPEEFVTKADEAVAAGRAKSFSAYVSEAPAERTDPDDPAVIVADWRKEIGPATEEERAWARSALALR